MTLLQAAAVDPETRAQIDALLELLSETRREPTRRSKLDATGDLDARAAVRAVDGGGR